MKRSRGLLLGLGGILVIVVIIMLTTYNSLVKKEENVRQYWGNLNTAYQRRNDLIPSIVAVVKGASQFEKNVMVEVAEARARASQLSFSGDVNFQAYQQLEQAQGEMANSVNRALAVVENYPDLKATQSFTRLQSQLEGTERRVKLARKDFNTAVADYNNSVRQFPGKIFAGIMGFKVREGFQASAGADKAPEINFKT
jgi:LemA protein